MSTPLTAERRDELDTLHRAVEVKGINGASLASKGSLAVLMCLHVGVPA
jgi:hypothetical protein